MSESTFVADQRVCFQLKASFSPCTIMQLTRYDLDDLGQQLAATVSRAPTFFAGSPLILDLEAVKVATINFAALKQILLTNQLAPVGVRGGSEAQHDAAANAGIPVIAIGKSASAIINPAEEPAKKTEEVRSATKLMTGPVRSGMQVYARDGDLIVTAPVSAGAELLADGHIHVYGPLRGRALAGMQGNTQARIFCRSLEAELVAIAGYYLVKEEIKSLPAHDSMVQIYLENEQVKIEAM